MSKESDEKYRIVFETAKEMIEERLPEGYSFKDLEGYFYGDSIPKSLEDVFARLIGSAQNSQWTSNVIQYWNREERIRELLHDYDIEWLAEADPVQLAGVLREEFGDTRKDGPRYTWRKWSNSIVDSAKFVSKFHSLDDFKRFVDSFNVNDATRAALPLYMAQEISGIGFALACDTLKELGYLDYPKPDTHIRDICIELGFCEDDAIDVFETVVSIARATGETPYKVDKVFWLLCSGDFYKGFDYVSDRESIGRQKNNFIETASMRIKEMA